MSIKSSVVRSPVFPFTTGRGICAGTGGWSPEKQCIDPGAYCPGSSPLKGRGRPNPRYIDSAAGNQVPMYCNNVTGMSIRSIDVEDTVIA